MFLSHTGTLFLSLDTLPPNVKFMNFEAKEKRGMSYKKLPLQSSNKSHHSSEPRELRNDLISNGFPNV